MAGMCAPSSPRRAGNQVEYTSININLFLSPFFPPLFQLNVSERTCIHDIKKLIDWRLRTFQQFFQSYHNGQFTYSCVFWLSLTSTPHKSFSKQLAAFPHRDNKRTRIQEYWVTTQFGLFVLLRYYVVFHSIAAISM